MFVYGGCGGNRNNFHTIDECNKACNDDDDNDGNVKNKCLLESSVGDCKASIEKFYYNRETKKCEPFIYGGCGGNENRFDSVNECRKACDVNKCSLPQEQGMCLAWIPRYFFNATSQRCEFFVYGGCDGNENNFETMDSCIGECSSRDVYKINETCLAEKVEGKSCKASIERYYFNKETFRCEKFNYGGCDGNENNFETALACESKCFGFNV